MVEEHRIQCWRTPKKQVHLPVGGLIDKKQVHLPVED